MPLPAVLPQPYWLAQELMSMVGLQARKQPVSSLASVPDILVSKTPAKAQGPHVFPGSMNNYGEPASVLILAWIGDVHIC